MGVKNHIILENFMFELSEDVMKTLTDLEFDN